ncbi:MAG: Hsp20/alpha crystallin family protein [Phycisphaerales bacterium]|nr:MAG: Hsp20/alpha crystallin family protein [Phycisphaerales bacterium]
MLMRRLTMNPVRTGRPTWDRVFDSMFEDMANASSSIFSATTFPPLNVWQDEQAVYVEAELPGFSRDQIELDVHEHRLTIRGERTPQDSENVDYIRRERPMGKFTRTLDLPVEFEAERVEASLENGVLLVTLPKSAKATPRRIEVRGQSNPAGAAAQA